MSAPLARWLLRFARRLANRPGARRFLSLLIGWFFTHMSFAIPAKRLRETDRLLAFHHPQPAYALHIVLVPKQPIESLSALDSADAALLQEIILAVQSLVREFDLEKTGYRLIINGGPHQEFPHLHAHLVSEGSSGLA